MKIVLPGGSGQIGGVLARALRDAGHDVTVIARGSGDVRWDGKTLGPWASVFDGADVVVNLAGRTVNCRYTAANLREMMSSRVDSTRVVGQAIGAAKAPPRVWLQMSTATIYAHRFDAPNDEASGVLGGGEAGAPAYWGTSCDIARAWEAAQRDADTPRTRKVALRTAVTLNPEHGSIFDVLLRMVRAGLGGPVGGGRQFVSWLHQDDFVRAVTWLVARDDIEGPVNLAAPTPLPQRDFMAALRRAWGTSVGLPATAWMAEIGAFVLRTDTELLLKSRYVIPGRLRDAGFTFAHPTWPEAAQDLVARWRTLHRAS